MNNAQRSNSCYRLHAFIRNTCRKACMHREQNLDICLFDWGLLLLTIFGGLPLGSSNPTHPYFAPYHKIHPSVNLKACKTSSCFSSSPLQDEDFVFILYPINASQKFSPSRVYTAELFVASKLRLISANSRIYTETKTSSSTKTRQYKR